MVNEEPNALSRINSSTFLASIPILFLRLIFTTSLYFLNDRNVSKLGRDRWLNVGFRRFAGTYRGPEVRKIVIFQKRKRKFTSKPCLIINVPSKRAARSR